MLNNDLDTLNCNQLKETFGFDGEEKSNFQLFGIGKPSAKQLARWESKGLKKDVTQQITGCVRPKALKATVGGLLLGGIPQITALARYKKDMKVYKACLNNFKAKTQAEAEAKAKAIEDARVAQEKLASIKDDKLSVENIAKMTDADKEELKKALGVGTERTSDTTSDDKIMGIPKTGFYIGVGVIALVGGFLLYKKFGK